MDALGDDVFGEPVSALPPQDNPFESELIPDIDDALPSAGAQPYAQELDMSGFGQEQAQPAAPGADLAAPPVLSAEPVVQLSIEDTQAAFIGGYTPNPIEQQVIPPSPTANDPRTAWRKKNQDGLAKKDKEEAAAKKAAADKAKAFVTKFAQDRSKHLDTTKKTNRQAEKASPESGVPPGATWEKVTLLINFQRQDKAHVKDMSRFKSCLQTCKTLNVPVATR